ncbi:hypothetical protein EMIHUDRAFT_247128 [Emiliania huxleyi CCMP1516]|nr:hypothetical protein EMIHUDRAFT_247128 [Emiliania huxleyi CCMP1516]EOD13054.1 hypothetical protein EMIHUDRAFT_247128 [Emiliania huxleyi CCMP1516]|eukprot:XP_005765483.1 hypothetical protein EMIHUDRAFT_247128 [Emiliania huxleyi CCMP1516]
MVASGVGVKKSQRASLGSLLALLDELRDACVMAELPAMLLRVWSAAGLDAMHQRKERSQRRALAPLQGTARDRGDEGVADAGGQGAGGGDSSAMRLPSEVSSLVEVATAFSTEYAARERAAAGSERSLFALCRTYVLDHAAELQLSALPDCVVDELFASRGRGRSVMRAFLTEVAMRSSAADAQDAAAEGSSKVSISTIHRAKGLEWCDVYVPFLNDGLLPMGYREETGNTAQRHKPQCAARRANGHCDLNCARAYREADAHARGTPEERHADEERRLAHVAATRAKDRLVFITVQLRREGAFAARNAMEPSPYERSLRAALPEETLVTRVRGELQDAEE